jgi:hypothetical protein
LKVTSLVGSLLVGRELMVETSAHHVIASMVTSGHLVVMQFHDRVSLVIEVSLTPDIMPFLSTLSMIMVAGVFRSIEHLLVWLQSNGAVTLTAEPII